jgi:hypothetical protein
MCNLDTHANFIAWYRDMFGFTVSAATMLYDVQLVMDKATLSELNDGNINNICPTICQDSNQQVDEVAMTLHKLLSFWIKHQDETCHKIGTTSKLLVQTTVLMLNMLKEQKQLKENWATDNKEPNYISTKLDLLWPPGHLRK